MQQRVEALARWAAERRFSGVVRVDRSGRTEIAQAFGLAERAFRVPNTLTTRFGIASGCKAFTALTVVALIDEDRLSLSTPVRSVLGDSLPEVDDRVTVEHLLAHRSGIGDYVDEDAGFDVSDYVMRVPLHELATTEGYLAALQGHPSKFSPGDRFSYNNSGYVLLALVAERVTGIPFRTLVSERVCRPADMSDTDYLRSDELPAGVARGYLTLDGLRTNVLHLPVLGSGDGGIYSTVEDVHRFWAALFDGRIVPVPWLQEMLRPRSDVPAESRRYGLGFWLHRDREVVILEGSDAGVSFRSVHDPSAAATWTVVSNTSDGAWPIAGLLDETFLG
jgi:CubicO group peptidase (beta-lactamase class C family)